jgi:hypothetical protein
MLAPEQAARLEAMAPGICLDTVRRALAADGTASPEGELLMDFREVDSVERLIQRIAEAMSPLGIDGWSIRSCTPERQAYSWFCKRDGTDYEVHERRAQRQWFLRVKPRLTYRQIVRAAPPDFAPSDRFAAPFDQPQRLAMQRVLMTTTALIAERDIPRADPDQRRHAIGRIRAVTSLFLCATNARRRPLHPAPSAHPVVRADDVMDEPALFRGLADAMSRGCVADWRSDADGYSWTTAGSPVRFEFYRTLAAVWYIRDVLRDS